MPVLTPFGAAPEDRATARVVGCGGAGCNAALDFPPTPAVEIIAFNDFFRPAYAAFGGSVLSKGQPLKGIAMTDDRVVKSLETDIELELAAHLRPADLVFILAGLGGNTGTWAASISARVGNLLGATTIAVVNLPFTVEGSNRRRLAREGFRLLHARARAVLPFKNDHILRIAPDLPILKAFQVMDHLMLKPLSDLSQLLTTGDLPNLRRALAACRHWRMGVGEGRGDHRFFVAVEGAVESPWVDMPLENVREAIVFIEGEDLSPKECAEALRELSNFCPGANVFWGALDRETGGVREVRVSVILGA